MLVKDNQNVLGRVTFGSDTYSHPDASVIATAYHASTTAELAVLCGGNSNANLRLHSNGKHWMWSKRGTGEGEQLRLYSHNGSAYSWHFLAATDGRFEFLNPSATNQRIVIGHNVGVYLDFYNSSGNSLGYLGDSATDFKLTARSGIATTFTTPGGFDHVWGTGFSVRRSGTTPRSLWYDPSSQTLVVNESNNSGLVGRVHIAGHQSTGLNTSLTFGLGLTDIRGRVDSWVHSGGYADLIFQTMNTSLVLTEHARIAHSGHMSVGPLYPSARLHVSQDEAVRLRLESGWTSALNNTQVGIHFARHNYVPSAIGHTIAPGGKNSSRLQFLNSCPGGGYEWFVCPSTRWLAYSFDANITGMTHGVYGGGAASSSWNAGGWMDLVITTGGTNTQIRSTTTYGTQTGNGALISFRFKGSVAGTATVMLYGTSAAISKAFSFSTGWQTYSFEGGLTGGTQSCTFVITMQSGITGTFSLDDLEVHISPDYSNSFAYGDRQMMLNGSGWLGIGKLPGEPLGNLHVSSGAGTNGKAIFRLEADADNSNEDATPIIEFAQDGSSAWNAIGTGLITGDTNTNILTLSSGVSGGGIGFATSSTSGYAVATWRMFLNTAGDLFLGGLNNGSQYNHGGTARVLEVHNSGTAANSQAHLMLSTGATSNTGAAGSVSWAVPGASGNKLLAYIGGLITQSSTSSANGALTFGTANAGVIGERMRLTREGVLGIGRTPTVYGLLDVAGSVLIGSAGSEADRINSLLSIRGAAACFQQLTGEGIGTYNAGITGTNTSNCYVDFGASTALAYRFRFGGTWSTHPGSTGSVAYVLAPNQFQCPTVVVGTTGSQTNPAIDLSGFGTGLFANSEDHFGLTVAGQSVMEFDHYTAIFYSFGSPEISLIFGSTFRFYDERNAQNLWVSDANGNINIGPSGTTLFDSRLTLQGRLGFFGNAASNPDVDYLTTNTGTTPTDSFQVYPKGNKIVFAYQVSGTAYYLTVDMNTSTGTATWTRTTTAP